MAPHAAARHDVRSASLANAFEKYRRAARVLQPSLPMLRTPGRRARTATVLLTTLSSGCIGLVNRSSPLTPPIRDALDVPIQFVTEDMPVESTANDTLPGSGCRSPLVDPRDGTRLRLRSSVSGVGDYEVPVGRYGVNTNERLRVDCNTGRSLGIVAVRD
jgi:hypothetical protein